MQRVFVRYSSVLYVVAINIYSKWVSSQSQRNSGGTPEIAEEHGCSQCISVLRRPPVVAPRTHISIGGAAPFPNMTAPMPGRVFWSTYAIPASTTLINVACTKRTLRQIYLANSAECSYAKWGWSYSAFVVGMSAFVCSTLSVPASFECDCKSIGSFRVCCLTENRSKRKSQFSIEPYILLRYWDTFANNLNI